MIDPVSRPRKEEEPKEQPADNEPVDRKWHKAMFANPSHEPGHGSVSNDERHDDPNEQQHPAMRAHARDSNRILALAKNGLCQIVTCARHHDRYRQEERKFQGGWARHSYDLATGDRGHRARGSWEYGGKNLANADPDRLAESHILHMPGANTAAGSFRPCRFRFCVHRVHDPHYDSADDERHGDNEETLKVLANRLDQQQRWDRRDDKRHGHKAQRVSEDGTIAPLAARKRRKKFCDSVPKVDGENENRAELNHNREHFPVWVREKKAHHLFRDSQMSSGADRQKFGEAFDDSQNYRDEVVVQRSSAKCIDFLARDRLQHGKGVAAIGIVAFANSDFTIAVLLPEGNRGNVVRCGVERDFANTFRGKPLFGFND